ncbi:hypothetical protein SAMN05444320_104143 [Streptoalloteichus hindustanus]|uniref:Uncharacterized protein n=1 Tax=Streptoalloteichus hindustanus TaxID=2017 RepID=A0A1M5CRX1_STRHI|nr:hypothetical protein SAMN05444320_104143 [Streptoalloteichus hindustanus]
MYDPEENYEPPTCAECGTELDSREHIDAVEPWLHGVEPTFTCGQCGWSALAGDWPMTWGLAVGDIAVSLANWTPMSETFIKEVSRLRGGRCGVVRARY